MQAAYDAIVIGAGAAGLMAALTAGQRGRRVLVIDHANRPGKKILMSGGGRCNFTNTGTTPAQFLSANPHFVRSALARYAPTDFIAMVKRHGIGFHEKELGQLFCDDSAKRIVAMLLAECADGGVELRMDCRLQQLDALAPGFRVDTSQGVCTAARVVVATGGLSVPTMGATGIGYELAKGFGHAVLPTRAGLVPLTLSGVHQERVADLSGLALPIEARVRGEGRRGQPGPVVAFRNQMLLTHRGLSGPALLQASNYWQPGGFLELDLHPRGDAFEALKALQRARGGIALATALGETLPARFAKRLCEAWFEDIAFNGSASKGGAREGRPLAEMRDAELRRVADALHAWPITPSGTEGYRTAEVTLGGIDTREVSSTTLESQRVPGLHFVGEVLDVTGWLGGYNFQWAWASGWAAAQAL
jgi:predicted Rossmann fold flavoprotein